MFLLAALCVALSAPPAARADVHHLDFEDLPDLEMVGNFYAAHGIHFSNTIALTAGFSLNEFDYPPHSGVMVVGDSGGPIGMSFDSPVLDFHAWFTHGSAISIWGFSNADFTSPLGGVGDPGANLGTSSQFALGSSSPGFRSISISGAAADSLAMDDLTWETQQTAVPEPGSAILLAGALLGFGLLAAKRKRAARYIAPLALLVLLAPASFAARGVFHTRATPDEVYILTPSAVTVTAEVGADAGNPLLPTSVSLFETTAAGAMIRELGKMYDDGTHGDVVSADTIFTGIFSMTESAPVARYVRVSVAYSGVRNRILGDIVPIVFYPPMPPNLVPTVSAFVTNLQNLFTANLSLGVATARHLALNAAIADPHVGAASANLTGEILSMLYKYTDPGTGFVYEVPGVAFLGDPAHPGDGAGRSVPVNLPADYKSPGNDKLLLFGPGYNTADPQNAIMDHAAAQFNNTEYMTFTPNPPSITAAGSASLEVVKRWGNYGTIIIHTHGGLWTLGTTQQVILLSGTSSSWWNQFTYVFDLLSKRIAVAGDRLAFYPSFVTRYVGGMPNTFIYLGACESLQNDTMWDALKAKGAKVGFGWSETVSRTFNSNTFATLIDPMLPHTNPPDPMTAEQAFNHVAVKTDNIGTNGATLTMRTASAEWNKFLFTEGGIVNGDFETGDWTGWTHGASLSDGRNYQIVVGAQKHGGSWSGALGRWDTAYSGYNPTAEPSGYEWFYQDFVVPSNATKLSFWWWMETYDTAIWDWFDAYIMNPSGSVLLTLVSHGGKPGSNYGPYWNTGSWRYVEADVTAFHGQKIRIYFDQRLDGFGDQQRTYVDDVQVR